MREFNYGNTIVKAPTYLEADHKAKSLNLDVLVSDETFNKLAKMLKSNSSMEESETIGYRDIYFILKTNDDDGYEGIHFSVCERGDDICLLTKDQIKSAMDIVKDIHGDHMEFYDLNLEVIF